MKQKKEYIITYKSQEHCEVLGWVNAFSIEEAKKKAKKELLKEAKYYEVIDARIAEWKNSNDIHFDIS